MRKVCLLLLPLLVSFLGKSYANPGDTTWVQAQHFSIGSPPTGFFDTVSAFPNGNVSYRKILMYSTLGIEPCPGGGDCHQWDGIMSHHVITPGGDTLELARIITPYATSGWPPFPAGWKHDYIIDVTDFYLFLKNNVHILFWWSGGNNGFTMNVRFALIEGTPDRDVTGIERLFHNNTSAAGGVPYGNAADPISSYFPLETKTPPTGTQSAEMRFIISGHGSDTNQCCEFASHYYSVFLNGDSIAHKDIWRNDCGVNPMYPQGGTWLIDRANWCPGSIIAPIYHPLPGILAGSNYGIQIKFQDYTVSNPSGAYFTQAQVIYHGGFNKTLDVSLDDIIAPSNAPDNFRENPASSVPRIKIHNSGSTPITSLVVQYGIKDSVLQQYTWNGNLAPLEDTLITLPSLNTLKNMSQSSASGIFTFVSWITMVNGQADNDALNDTLRSSFVAAPNWPGDIVISMKTDNIDATGNYLNQNPNGASWTITDMNGAPVASRSNTTYTTQYNDTIALPAPGFYKFMIKSTTCTGLHWWLYDQRISGYKPGTLRIRKLDGTSIPMNGYTYAGSNLKDNGPHDDFGCEYAQYFTVTQAGTWVTGIPDVNNADDLLIYPNPTRNVLNIDNRSTSLKLGEVTIFNTLGAIVYQGKMNGNLQKIKVDMLASGLYSVRILSNKGFIVRKFEVIK